MKLMRIRDANHVDNNVIRNNCAIIQVAGGWQLQFETGQQVGQEDVRGVVRLASHAMKGCPKTYKTIEAAAKDSQKIGFNYVMLCLGGES